MACPGTSENGGIPRISGNGQAENAGIPMISVNGQAVNAEIPRISVNGRAEFAGIPRISVGGHGIPPHSLLDISAVLEGSLLAVLKTPCEADAALLSLTHPLRALWAQGLAKQH